MAGTYFVSTKKPILPHKIITLDVPGVYPEESEARGLVDDISEYICYRNIGFSHEEAIFVCKPKN